ncbi:MAG: enoyl-CoA hydratase/isomerase family protein, partial [Burkholderiales bacterium]|nr:enoyl-CoA hydratase/isomerase family protein [Burkholderiales bacterium]
MSDPILVQREADIATVVLNRPEKLNALTKSMWAALGDAIEALSADDEVRCIVIRGARAPAVHPRQHNTPI